MREILFRARAVNRDKGYHRTKYKNGDWVYGLLSRPYDERFENLPAEMTDTSSVSGIEVDYKTIAQYTGLTDKNGTKIFEGDIVRLTDDTGIENTFIITWDSRRAMFYLDSPTFKTDFYYYSANEFEVIGNIHDNPELLGELMKLTSKDVAQSGLAPATENFELMPG